MALYIQESYINASENYRCGESEVYETRFDKPGELYRFLVREFGRCISKMYVEMKDGTSKHIGWVFQKRQKYDDSKEKYLAETWVSLHEGPPERSIKYHYAELG